MLATIEHQRLRVAVQERNSGKGEAVRRGLLAAAGRARAFLDGGGDIPAQCLLDAYRLHVASVADIVVGSKLHTQSVVEYPPARRIYSWGYRQLTRLLFGLTVRDTQVGLKIYAAPVVEQVFPHVRTSGFAFDIEALASGRPPSPRCSSRRSWWRVACVGSTPSSLTSAPAPFPHESSSFPP